MFTIHTGVLRPRPRLPRDSKFRNSIAKVGTLVVECIDFVEDGVFFLFGAAKSHQVAFCWVVIFCAFFLVTSLPVVVPSDGRGRALKPAKRDGRPTEEIP